MFRHRYLAVAILFAASLLLITGFSSLWPTLVAALGAYAIIAMGLAILGGLAQPVPGPPPPGELRKVKITFRCSICGSEVRMTAAPSEEPEAPRHCTEEMDLVAPIDE